MTMNDIQTKLRKANRKNYVLYLFCNFTALLLISAYSALMFSPTVLEVLPEGGDSRKMVNMIFVMTIVGCVVFTVYAASLFFRMKSKEIGIFLALGASQRRLMPMVIHEAVYLSVISALVGAALGIPFAAGIWQLFRFFIVNTEEMKLRLNYASLTVPLILMVVVIGAAVWTGRCQLKKSNIMDVISQEHKNEPVKELKRWCGPVGILLLVIGGVTGYFSSTVYMALFSAYPPAWINLAYLPALIGLYLVLLHTVVHGWGRKKNQYKKIIAHSMMKFQGKQTVNNMLVVTVLIAGGSFGLSFLPTNYIGMNMDAASRPYEYMYHYPDGQSVPKEAEVHALAEKYDRDIAEWKEAPYIALGMDAQEQVMEDENKYHYEYTQFASEGNFLAESSYEYLTGETIEIPEGTYQTIGTGETANYFSNAEATLLTNMETRETLPIQCTGELPYPLLSKGGMFYVISDKDFAALSQGGTEEWKGIVTFFNLKGEDSYAFAKELYSKFVEGMDEKWLKTIWPDRVQKVGMEEKGRAYEEAEGFIYDDKDSTNFKMYWPYVPQFQIMDKTDSVKNLAVFFMMFLFIAIVCYMAAMIICYTRCMTIAINNRYVFEDLARLGASPDYLKKEIKRQSGSVFAVPTVVGMLMICGLTTLIFYANDGVLTNREIAALIAFIGMMLLLGAIIYCVYRQTVAKMYQILIG